MFTCLNPPAQQLHADVERIYGRPIKLDIETHNPVFGGYSNILDDGTPWIILNDASFDPPSTLVHELFNLKHRAEGEPSIYHLVGKNVEQQRADEAFLVLEDVREFVAHMRFYGLMEAMGYQPKRWFDQHMQRLLSVGPNKEISYPLQQPLVVARVMLEAGDKALASELLSYFPLCVALGRELAAMVGSHTVVEIADRLLSGHGTRLQFLWHEERPKGQVVDRVVVVRVALEPPAANDANRAC